ncbi:hypothetical protein ACRAWF_14720 [Streptomyces sp. L7]
MLDLPGVTLYRWDERCLVSFLTVGRLSGEGVQLEVAVRSPLGTFVEQRFDELWQQGKPMDRFTHLPVTLVDAADGRREFSCRFVYVDDRLYVEAPDLVTYLAAPPPRPTLRPQRGAGPGRGVRGHGGRRPQRAARAAHPPLHGEVRCAGGGLRGTTAAYGPGHGIEGPGTHEFSAPPPLSRLHAP